MQPIQELTRAVGFGSGPLLSQRCALGSRRRASGIGCTILPRIQPYLRSAAAAQAEVDRTRMTIPPSAGTIACHSRADKAAPSRNRLAAPQPLIRPSE